MRQGGDLCIHTFTSIRIGMCVANGVEVCIEREVCRPPLAPLSRPLQVQDLRKDMLADTYTDIYEDSCIAMTTGTRPVMLPSTDP